MTRISIICSLLLIAISASGQSLSVYDIDASGFPVMKGKLLAFDANGVRQSPAASEVTITEGGITRTVTGISCPPKTTPPPITLGIMVDTYSGINLAKEGAQDLINSVAIPPGEAGITIMEHGAYIVQDLTQKSTKLTAAIASLTSAPGVDLQTMFYAQNSGGVPFVSGRPNKKALVLISDLHCPQFNLNKTQLLADCAKENISIYVVLLNTNDARGYFRDITANTGGALFEEIRTSADLKKVFLNISTFVSGALPCEITWQSAYECSDNPYRNCTAAWNGAQAQFNYPLSGADMVRLKVTADPLLIPGKVLGKRFDTTITITAINTSFNVTDISSSDPVFDVNPKSFSLAAGESKTLTVSFTPVDSNFRYTQFTITSDLCKQQFSAQGYPGVKRRYGTLKVTSPNGGEIYLTGADTLITWTGLAPTDSVRLEYSLDNGGSWNLITPFATGGSYLWHVPQQTSNLCLIRATQYIGSGGGSVRRIGSPTTYGQAFSAGIATDDFANVYITGSFAGAGTDFGGITITPAGSENMFIAKYNANDSLLWVKNFPYDSAHFGFVTGQCLATDHSGNLYVGGWFMASAVFNSDTLITAGGFYDEDMFLAKFHTDGTYEWVKHIQSSAAHAYEQVLGISNDPSGNIYISGFFADSARFGNTLLTGNSTNNGFIAKYHPDGTVEWANGWNAANANEATGVASDSSGNIFVTGYFTGSVDVGGGVKASGGNALLAKYNPDGSVAWAKAFGGQFIAEGTAVALSTTGEIVVAGKFATTADFGGVQLTSVGSTDMFVAKFAQDGSLRWAKRAGGIDRAGNNFDNSAKGLSIDKPGNIFVTGTFSGTADFDTIKVKATAGQDFFFAQYKPDGNIGWVRRAAPSGNNEFTTATSPSGSVYATGSVWGDGDFANQLSKKFGLGVPDAFIWKIGGRQDIQNDVSDAVFSIIAPTFSIATKVIDLGQCIVGKEKDSAVKSTICNNGTYPLHILGMDVTGGDKTEFMIMSGAGDFTLQPGECRDVIFTFMPMMAAKMSASVTVRTANGDYPDTIKILGEGINPELKVIGNLIDFGQVTIGSMKDTTISVAIQNIGSVPFDFTSNLQLGPDMKQFSLQSGATPFTLAPGASQTVTLRFSPKYIGRTSGRIAFDYNGVGSPAILNLFGQGLGGLVAIPDDSGYAGDHKSIPMILKKVPISSVQSVATNFTARIAYDRTVLYPNSGSVLHGSIFDTLSVSGSFATSDTLALLPFTALLGDAPTSPMNIVDFNWLDGSGNPADYDAETQSGTFHLLGICPAGGNRLYDPNGQVTMAHITPNPSNGIIHIDIHTTELGRTQLAILNLLGMQVGSISDGELKPGAHSFDFNTSNLSAGSYFLLMQTPTVRKLERIDVSR